MYEKTGSQPDLAPDRELRRADNLDGLWMVKGNLRPLVIPHPSLSHRDSTGGGYEITAFDSPRLHPRPEVNTGEGGLQEGSTDEGGSMDHLRSPPSEAARR